MTQTSHTASRSQQLTLSASRNQQPTPVIASQHVRNGHFPPPCLLTCPTDPGEDIARLCLANDCVTSQMGLGISSAVKFSKDRAYLPAL